MPVDDALTLLALAVLYELPLFVAAMACTWLVHEWSLHGWARLRGRSVASRRFWTRTVWDHPNHFLVSYFLLFLAFLALFQTVFVAAHEWATGPGSVLLGSVPAFAWGFGLLFLGAAALRVRLRSATT